MPQCREIKSVEIIISDNASTDGTKNVCQELVERHDWLRYICQERNVGYANNLKSALQAARGQYSWMLGDDESVHSTAVKTIISSLQRYYPALLICNFANLQTQSDNWLFSRQFDVEVDIHELSLNEILQLTGKWASLMSVNVVRSAYFNDWLNSNDADQRSDYAGFEISLYAGSKGKCSLLAKPLIARIKSPLITHRFLKLNTYAFQFFAPLNRLKKQRTITGSTRNKLAVQMYIGMVGFLLLKSRMTNKETPALWKWLPAHGQVPSFWFLIFPILILPRWFLLSLVSILRSLVCRNWHIDSKTRRMLDGLP